MDQVHNLIINDQKGWKHAICTSQWALAEKKKKKKREREEENSAQWLELGKDSHKKTNKRQKENVDLGWKCWPGVIVVILEE